MAQIMEFLLNFLLLRGKFLTTTAAETLYEAIKKCLLFKRKISMEYNTATQMIGPFDNMLEFINYNSRQYRCEGENFVVTSEVHYELYEQLHKLQAKEKETLSTITANAPTQKKSLTTFESTSKIEELSKSQNLNAIPEWLRREHKLKTDKKLPNEEHLVDNLHAILRSQELVFKNIIKLVNILQKERVITTNSKKLEKLKKKLVACTDILTNNATSAQFSNIINNIIEEEITRCRFRHGKSKTSSEISLKTPKPEGIEAALDTSHKRSDVRKIKKRRDEKTAHIRRETRSQTMKPETLKLGERKNEILRRNQIEQEAKTNSVKFLRRVKSAPLILDDWKQIQNKQARKNYETILKQTHVDLENSKKLIEVNEEHFNKFEDTLWHSLTTMKFLSLKDDYLNMCKCAFYNKRQFVATESAISTKLQQEADREHFQKFVKMSDSVFQIMERKLLFEAVKQELSKTGELPIIEEDTKPPKFKKLEFEETETNDYTMVENPFLKLTEELSQSELEQQLQIKTDLSLQQTDSATKASEAQKQDKPQPSKSDLEQQLQEKTPLQKTYPSLQQTDSVKKASGAQKQVLKEDKPHKKKKVEQSSSELEAKKLPGEVSTAQQKKEVSKAQEPKRKSEDNKNKLFAQNSSSIFEKNEMKIVEEQTKTVVNETNLQKLMKNFSEGISSETRQKLNAARNDQETNTIINSFKLAKSVSEHVKKEQTWKKQSTKKEENIALQLSPNLSQISIIKTLDEPKQDDETSDPKTTIIIAKVTTKTIENDSYIIKNATELQNKNVEAKKEVSSESTQKLILPLNAKGDSLKSAKKESLKRKRQDITALSAQERKIIIPGPLRTEPRPPKDETLLWEQKRDQQVNFMKFQETPYALKVKEPIIQKQEEKTAVGSIDSATDKKGKIDDKKQHFSSTAGKLPENLASPIVTRTEQSDLASTVVTRTEQGDLASPSGTIQDVINKFQCGKHKMSASYILHEPVPIIENNWRNVLENISPVIKKKEMSELTKKVHHNSRRSQKESHTKSLKSITDFEMTKLKETFVTEEKRAMTQILAKHSHNLAPVSAIDEINISSVRKGAEPSRDDVFKRINEEIAARVRYHGKSTTNIQSDTKDLNVKKSEVIFPVSAESKGKTEETISEKYTKLQTISDENGKVLTRHRESPRKQKTKERSVSMIDLKSEAQRLKTSEEAFKELETTIRNVRIFVDRSPPKQFSKPVVKTTTESRKRKIDEPTKKSMSTKHIATTFKQQSVVFKNVKQQITLTVGSSGGGGDEMQQRHILYEKVKRHSTKCSLPNEKTFLKNSYKSSWQKCRSPAVPKGEMQKCTHSMVNTPDNVEREEKNKPNSQMRRTTKNAMKRQQVQTIFPKISKEKEEKKKPQVSLVETDEIKAARLKQNQAIRGKKGSVSAAPKNESNVRTVATSAIQRNILRHALVNRVLSKAPSGKIHCVKWEAEDDVKIVNILKR